MNTNDDKRDNFTLLSFFKSKKDTSVNEVSQYC